MCRNITTLRGLEPAATSEEIEAAARQFVRKVSGVQSTSPQTEDAFERAVTRVTDATAELESGTEIDEFTLQAHGHGSGRVYADDRLCSRSVLPRR